MPFIVISYYLVSRKHCSSLYELFVLILVGTVLELSLVKQWGKEIL